MMAIKIMMIALQFEIIWYDIWKDNFVVSTTDVFRKIELASVNNFHKDVFMTYVRLWIFSTLYVKFHDTLHIKLIEIKSF